MCNFMLGCPTEAHTYINPLKALCTERRSNVRTNEMKHTKNLTKSIKQYSRDKANFCRAMKKVYRKMLGMIDELLLFAYQVEITLNNIFIAEEQWMC